MKEKAKKKTVKTKHKLQNSIYTCPHCPKKFDNASNWHSHIKLHSTEEPYHCELCDYKCKVKKYLSRHVKKAHTKPTGHKCPICGKCFHYNSGLRNHMRVHTGEKPYKCGDCDKAFSSLYSLNGHKMIHTGEKPFQCQYCDYACRDNSTIRRHMERHLGVSKDYPCSICNKNFKKKETLKFHVDEVHFELDTRKYPCELCDKVFKTKATLTFHIHTVHEKTNRVKCEICGRVTSKNNLQAHMRRHIDLKPYKCSYKPCGRRFADKGDLKRHLTIHYPENQYVCTVCNRRYSRKFRLNQHMRNGCRRAQCHYCGQLFSTKFFVAQHIKNAHGPYPKSREYVCDVCDMVTYSRRGIIQHLKYGHGTEKDTKCQICKKDFFKYVTLKEHYLSHHNLKYCLMEKKNRCKVVVKVEPLDETEEIVDSSDFIYEVPIEKQENIDDTPPQQILKPTSPERLTIDSDTITYSKKVLSEDISLCLLEREKEGHVFDDFFIGHAMQKQETKLKPLKQIVDEKKKERVEKRLVELLNIARIRNQSVILEKLRKQYNRRIKMATGGGDKKEPKQNIRYFKNPNINKSSETGNDIDDKETNIEEDNNTNNQDSNGNQQNTPSAKQNSKNIDQNDEIGEDIQNNDKGTEIVDKNQTNDEENDDEPIDDPKDVDYKESDSDGETNPNGKLTFNTHQCYICFKLFKTKAELKLHCRDHFELCNDKMLKKCPFCGYVTNLTITKHIKDVHNIFYDIRKNGRIKEKNTENGPKYVFQIDKDCDLEIIPSISNLNKIASMKIDEKKRQSQNLFLGTTKLVRKGGDWMVQKQKVDISNEYLLPEFSDYDYQTLKSIGDTYLERIRTLSILAKKKGIKILYPCEDCDKICLTMSALKLHNRKHEANPKTFKPKVWKNKIVNGFNGRYTHVNKKSNRKKKQANVTQNNNAVVPKQKANKKPRKLERIVKNDTAPIANRFANPNPVKNKHKCDRELIEFYKKNIKGGDIEFWQFLKIFNKMSRENVNDFKDLENRFDFGMHNIKTDSSLAKDNRESIEPTDSIKEVGCNDSVNTKPKKTKVLRNSKAFTRAIMISKKEYLRRLEIKNQMRERFKGTPT